MKKYIVFIFIACSAIGCNENNPSKTTIPKNDSIEATSLHKEFGERDFITGDFNGDMMIDTVHESYISSHTHRETFKYLDTNSIDNNMELVIKNKPISRLYTNILSVDTFIVSSEEQQMGISYFMNIGDLNDDKKDEIGYTIRWADYSNLNTYHIITLHGNKFEEILSFGINEAVNFDPAELFDEDYLIKKTGYKTIIYKFYSDSATVETGTYTFK